ncbi:ATP-binding mismatch repair protein [Malassezia vespertilionis]|uniref:Pms1p n=1 Tax=Malassezia vespertilionis TaxID=2020962 RepID=A0A2N1JBH2_9BASI|nr:ATP-binding mismatch repair protein [Malassezia vespertilionis]PKI83894.1 hypothetical protein MVES_002245 [Malassezia vespertilionis]WFD07022.1 ATP-binding mismatch repair protein [Malassezia vespertilionis]
MPIVPLARSDVLRIAGAQVVPDMRAAVKELVENALDAGATSIEVRFKEYGLEGIEVVDNGSGIARTDYVSLARKHHTSKIASFEDLGSVATFGFRGEALASLCSVSSVSVLTATDQDAPMGTVLDFNENGELVGSEKRMARQRGTTVSVSDLLTRLPVRRRELEKNIKREYNKTYAMLQTYALVSKGVRWASYVTLQSGKRVSQLNLRSASLQANIAALFGPRATAHMMPMALDVDLAGQRVHIKGFISKPTIGSGRSSGDRQYFYINGRPWDTGRMAQICNQVYRMYNATQYPCVIADVVLDTHAYDVNVSPDKRTIYLHDQSALLEAMREALDEMYAPTRGVLEVHGPFRGGDAGEDTRKRTASPVHAARKSARMEERASSEASVPADTEAADAPPAAEASTMRTEFQRAVDTYVALQDAQEKEMGKETEVPCTAHDAQNAAQASHMDTQASRVDMENERVSERRQPMQQHEAHRTRDSSMSPSSTEASELEYEERVCIAKRENTRPSHTAPPMDITYAESEMELEGTPAADLISNCSGHEANFISDRSSPPITDHAASIRPPQHTLTLDMHDLALRIQARTRTSSLHPTLPSTALDHAGFSERDMDTAAHALERVIQKKDFGAMQIVGQFNLGFIIARRLQHTASTAMDDLFIIDQHAADEKYNYERLQASTQIQSQPLLLPQLLELAPTDELIAAEYEAWLQRNGFAVRIDQDAPPGARVHLLTKPISKDIVFDVHDFEELIAKLRDSPRHARCSKVRDMFASRACRKSIMVGSALDARQMRLVVHHMGEIEQPWNCPHGRPTIRHLVSLSHAPHIASYTQRPVAWHAVDAR